MLKVLNTIHEPEKIFETAGKPMLVTCNDLELWVCKYYRDSNKLVNELLGSKFAECWNLKTPEVGLINVNVDHVPNGIPFRSFEKPCFGSKYISASKEIDNTVLSLFQDYNFRRKIANKTDFLKISLFDIWLSNEDRNHNNSNLLLDVSNTSEIYFLVFDHDSIFNSNSLNRGLFQINDFETLINTRLANILFRNNSRFVNTVENLINNFYICIKECEDNITEILQFIPQEWEINTSLLEKQLRDNLFTKDWLDDCISNFRTIIQTNIN